MELKSVHDMAQEEPSPRDIVIEWYKRIGTEPPAPHVLNIQARSCEHLLNNGYTADQMYAVIDEYNPTSFNYITAKVLNEVKRKIKPALDVGLVNASQNETSHRTIPTVQETNTYMEEQASNTSMIDYKNLRLKQEYGHEEFVQRMDIDDNGHTRETRKHLARLHQRVKDGEIRKHEITLKTDDLPF